MRRRGRRRSAAGGRAAAGEYLKNISRYRMMCSPITQLVVDFSPEIGPFRAANEWHWFVGQTLHGRAPRPGFTGLCLRLTPLR